MSKHEQAPHDDDAGARYDRFIGECLESGRVWGLKNKDGWAITESIEFEDTVVFPFWSTEEEARVHCSEDWKVYQTDSLSLEEFLADWLPGMHEDHAMVGPNWNRELEGLEVEPSEVAQRFDPED